VIQHPRKGRKVRKPAPRCVSRFYRPESLEPRRVLEATVVFNEIMYSPDTASGIGEWIELHNQMSVDIEMSNWTLGGAVEYTFPKGTVLKSGKYLVVAASPDKLNQATGITNLMGPMVGTLGNGGDHIELRNHTQRLMSEIRYGDSVPWPVGADGSGASLAKLDPQFGTEQPANWRASLQPGGTPGLGNFPLDAAPSAWSGLQLNEVAAGGAADFWVELKNTTDHAINLAGVQLRGSAGASSTIAGGDLGAGEYQVIRRDQLGVSPAAGERLFLYSPQAVELLDAALVENRLSGRSSELAGRWQFPSQATPGEENRFVVEQDVVINEIFYHASPTYAQPGVPSSSTILPLDTTWKYDDSGKAPAADWYRPQFSDGAWKEGKGLFHNESAALPGPKNTVLQANVTTYYFRTSFNLPADPQSANVAFSHVVDDGAVFYLNGKEVYRWNLPSGPITHDTLASPSVSNASLSAPMAFPKELLVAGVNQLAVEVHQNSTASPDAAFGLTVEVLHPPVGGSEFRESPEEWIELYNRSSRSIDLAGWKLGDAVDFEFPAATILGPGEYAVVANDQAALRAKFPTIRILGEFSGSLADSDENLQLLDARGNVADEVHYYDGGYWPQHADGGGQSIELRDPFADNSQPTSWEGSDESIRSSWNRYTYTKRVDPIVYDPPIYFHEFVMGLLDAGEILIDNLQVVNETTGASLLQNGTFDNQSVDAPADKWRIQGTHTESRVIADPDRPGNQVLNLVATGRTHYLSNHAETTLANGAKVVNGHTYTISFDAKWVAGSPQLHTELYYKDAAKTTILQQPGKSGTPGLRNTRYTDNLGPTIHHLQHSPLIPTPTDHVTISARADDPDQVVGMDLYWAVEGRAPFAQVAMQRQADGRFAATLPPQAHRTVVQFYVEARDARGAKSVYPPEGPDSRALYQARTSFAADPLRHDLHIIMTKDDTTELHRNVNMLDNHHRGATVITDGKDIHYDVGARLRGSMFTRQNIAATGYNVKFRPDDLYRGVHGNISIDQNGKNEIVVKFTAMQAGALGGTYDDILQLITPSGQGGGAVMAYLSAHGNVYKEAQFENGGEGSLFEFEGIRVMVATVDGTPEGLKLYQPIDWVGNFDIQDLGDDKELYRWPYLLDGPRAQDDYSSLIRMAKAFSVTGDAQEAALEEAMDMDNWTHTFALQSLFGIGDAYTQGNPHNLDLYARPSDGRMLALPWDWDFVFNLQPNAPLIGNANLGNILRIPTYNHLFLGHLQNLMETVFNRAYLETWVPYFGGMMRETSWGSILAGVDNRSAYVKGQLPARLPFLAGSTASPVVQKTLLQESSPASYFIPTEANGGSTLGLEWTTETFQEPAAWKQGSAAIGYEATPSTFDPLILTHIDEMFNNATSVYERIPFTVPADGSVDGLILRMKYDDGFVAYINGVRVASAAAPASLAWNSVSTTAHPNTESIVFVDYDLTPFRSLLHPGKNVLAIHGLNRSAGNIDALFVPQLIAQQFIKPATVEINTDQSVAAVTGRGWINVKSVRIKETGETIPLRWSDPTTWQAKIPVRTGRNELELEAIDFQGKVADSSKIIINSTAEQPVSQFLRISELMYHPADPTAAESAAGFTDADEFEFIELTHIGEPGNAPALNLAGSTFTSGVALELGTVNLAPGEYAVVVANTAAFRLRYGQAIRVLGQYDNQLANGGEQVSLRDPSGVTIVDFTYDDSAPWPTAADGQGPSLELINPRSTSPAQYGQATSWQASLTNQGSPGRANPTPLVADWNNDGRTDGADLALLCTAVKQGSQDPRWDLDGSQQVDLLDVRYMVRNILRSTPGDSNLDGVFDSRDLVQVFAAGLYEDGVAGNANWDTGDWNCDGDFTSADLVEAFANGAYVSASSPAAIAADSAASLWAAAVDAALVEQRQARRAAAE
jgi:hypothetical protein